MRRAGRAAVLAISTAFCLTGAALASVKVKTNTTSYRISGKSGDALLNAMDRRGPKHGFLTRAIAQTSYTVSWDIDWRESAGGCRIADAAATLSITYNYPAVSNAMSGDLKRRWQRFMAGVRKHEETHGRHRPPDGERSGEEPDGLSSRRDPGCSKTQAEVKRRIAATYAKYEARQVRFDEVEHTEGGNVEGLVDGCSAPQIGRRDVKRCAWQLPIDGLRSQHRPPSSRHPLPASPARTRTPPVPADGPSRRLRASSRK